jgi:hypothetical protein
MAPGWEAAQRQGDLVGDGRERRILGTPCFEEQSILGLTDELNSSIATAWRAQRWDFASWRSKRRRLLEHLCLLLDRYLAGYLRW